MERPHVKQVDVTVAVTIADWFASVGVTVAVAVVEQFAIISHVVVVAVGAAGARAIRRWAADALAIGTHVESCANIPVIAWKIVVRELATKGGIAVIVSAWITVVADQRCTGYASV